MYLHAVSGCHLFSNNFILCLPDGKTRMEILSSMLSKFCDHEDNIKDSYSIIKKTEGLI